MQSVVPPPEAAHVSPIKMEPHGAETVTTETQTSCQQHVPLVHMWFCVAAPVSLYFKSFNQARLDVRAAVCRQTWCFGLCFGLFALVCSLFLLLSKTGSTITWEGFIEHSKMQLLQWTTHTFKTFLQIPKIITLVFMWLTLRLQKDYMDGVLDVTEVREYPRAGDNTTNLIKWQIFVIYIFLWLPFTPLCWSILNTLCFTWPAFVIYTDHHYITVLVNSAV